MAPSLWCLAAATILVWIGILPFTQPAQRLRHEVEHQLTSGQIAEALATMSQHEPSDFPSHWDPPPWLAYESPQPPLINVMTVLLEQDVAPWVRATYFERFEEQVGARRWLFFGWREMSADERDQYLDIFESLPDRDSFIDTHAEQFQELWSVEEPARKERLRALLKEAGHEVRETHLPANDS